MSTQKSSSAADKKSTLFFGALIVIVLALGIAAIYPTLSENAFKRSLETGKTPQTLENIARYEEKDLDALIEEMGLTGKADGSTLYQDAINLMPLKVYCGSEEAVEEFKTTYSLDASVTGDTTYGEVAEAVQAAVAKMQEEAAAQAEAEAAAEAEATEAETEVAETEAAETEAATEAPAAE